MTTNLFLNRTRWLHSAFCTLILLFSLGVGNAWGTPSVIYTLTPVAGSDNSYAGNENIACEDEDNEVTITWNVTGNATMTPWRIGGKGGSKSSSTATLVRDIYCTSALSTDDVSKVILSHGTSTISGTGWSINSVTLIVSTSSDGGGTEISSIERAFKASDTIIINRPAGKDWSGKYFTIRYNISAKGTSNKYLEFSGAEFYAESGGCAGTKLGTPVVTATPSSGQVVLTWPNVSNASSYKLKWNGGDWETAVSGVTKSGTNGTSYTYQVKAIGNGTDYCDGDPSAEASVVPGTYYTVTFMNNGSTYDTKSILSGSNLVLPDNPSSCDVSKEFVGWSTNNIGSTPTDTKPTTFKSTFSTISANTTLYAVFAKKTANSYKLGDANDLIEGQKVLIVNQNASQAMSNTNNSGKLTATGVTISSSTISSPAASLIWTVELDGATKYKFKNTYYVYAYSTSAVYCDDDDSKYPDSWTLTYAGSTGKYYMHSDRSTSSYRLEDYNSKFYPYTSGTSEYFKHSFFVPEYTKYVTECCTQLGSINGSISWSNGQATVSWDAAGGCDSWGLKYKRHADSDIPANWTSYAGSFGTATGRTSNSTAISSLTAGTEYDFKITGTSDGSVYCSGTVTETKSSTVPKITASSSMTDLGYQEGETPVAQTFTVSGTQLTGNLTVDAPDHFLVSLDGSSWSSAGGTKSITVTTPPNNLGSTTIYVKAESGLSDGDNPSGNITISGGGAASVNVAVSATITEACTAPSSVSISGTTKYFGGQTISLTATPSGGVGETSYQWQKKISGVWTNVANGGGISGATTNNLQISSCTHSNSGGYRCVVSTGSTCSTKSHADDNAGYGVHVYSIYGRYYNEGEWAHNEIAYTSGTTGTATVHLSAKKTYTFKVRSNNDLYYGNSSGNFIIQPATNMDCGTNNSEIRLFTTIEGDYTITVDIAHGLDNSPYVTIAVSYPSMTHPNSGYVYVQKFSWRPYLHYWYDNSNKLTEWGSDPQLNSDQYTTICGTEYWCVPVIDYYCNFIAKDAAGDPSNTTGDQHTNSPHPGQKLYNDGSWKWAAIPTYTISYAGGTGSTGSMSSETGIVAGSSQTLTAFNTIAKAGYTFSCWHADQDVTIGGSTVDEGDDIADGATIQNICGNITLTAQWTANTNTAYTVKHYQQNIADNNYTEVTGDRQNLTGTTDASVTPAVKSYTGFTAPSTQTVTILGDGSLVVDYYYTRNSYNLTWNLGGGTTTTAGTGIASGVSVNTTSSVKYGTSLTAPTVTKTGYGFSAWSPSAPASTMPAAATTYTATWSATNYTITYNLNGGTQQVTPAPATNYTIESSAITLPTPTRAGYTFDGWYAASNFSGDVQTTIAAGSTGNKEYWAKWTAKEDTYKTALHTGASGWTSYASGVTKSGAGYTIPAPSSVTKGATSSCEDTHYHFAGWVADEYKGSPSGHIIAASGTTDATGATYWAVWEKEAAGGGGTSSITITRSTTGITATGYGSGVERTWTQSEIDFGGHYIMTNNANTPSGASASQYIVLQKSNGTLYNTEELPGAITEVEVIQYSELACNVYCGDERLMASDNTNTGQTPSGTLITKPDDATTMTWTISASNNYRFFALKAYTSSSSGTNYITSVKVTYSTITYEDPKAVCEACVATPSISGVSLTGSSFSTTSVPVQATGASAGDNCSLASYGFYWGTSASPTTNNTASDNLSTGTFSATLTGTFTIGTTYYYRAYATNEAPNTGYSSDGTFTLQNVTFNMHSHGGDAPATQVVPQGGKATDPGDPSETGYTFDGWYDNSSYTGSAWNFSTNTVGSGGVTLHAKWTEKPKYTITLDAGNGTISDVSWTNTSGSVYTKTQVNGDASITLPTPSCNCAGWAFQGWSTTSKSNAASFTPDKTDGAEFVPAANVTYYAVYRQSAPSGTTYNKITSTGDLTTGDYLFVCSTLNKAMTNELSGTHMTETSGFTASDASQTTSDATVIWTIVKFNTQVVIKNGTNFIGVGSDGNITFNTTPHFFTYTYDGANSRWVFTSVTYPAKQLAYNLWFKIEESQSSAIYLYKQGVAMTGNYYTSPVCSDISVTGVASPAAGGTVTLNAASAKTGDKVYAYYTPDADYNFVDWEISGTGSTLSSTSAIFTEITVGTAATTVTANFVAKDWKTVTWKANGETLTGVGLGSASVKVENGFNITNLPPTPSSCDAGVGASDQFMGWVVESENWAGKTNDLSEIHIYKKASQFPTVTGNVTYLAVWAALDDTKNAWEKVTDAGDVEAGFKYAVISFDDAYYVKNTDQSTDKPTVYAVTKTSGDINFTSDMEFNASAGPNDGFIFTSAAVSGVKIWGSSANDGVIVSTSSAKANASDEWFPELNATYGVIMTTSNSKYLCTYSTNDWRNYSSGYNATNRAANLYKYALGHKNYLTMCCDKEVTIGNPSKTGSGTVTFASGGNAYAVSDEVLTCLGATTITATVTPTNGYQCTALSFTRSDSEDLTPDPAISVPFTGAQSYDLTFEQNADGVTLNTTVTFVALIDHYIDNMHYNTTQNKSGNYGTAPTLSDESKGAECTGLHYKFIGWIPEDDMNMTTGVPTTTANMVAGGATGKYATGTNYYAIWAEEE